MDAGLPIRPVGGVAVTGDDRPPAGAVVASVATELAATKAVGGAADASPTQNPPPHPSPNNSNANNVIETVTIDPQSREVIYRVIDARTRQVIWQMPDELLLRNRAYAQAVANGTPPFLAEAQADLET
jgi:hypothetical protein